MLIFSISYTSLLDVPCLYSPLSLFFCSTPGFPAETLITTAVSFLRFPSRGSCPDSRCPPDRTPGTTALRPSATPRNVPPRRVSARIPSEHTTCRAAWPLLPLTLRTISLFSFKPCFWSAVGRCGDKFCNVSWRRCFLPLPHPTPVLSKGPTRTGLPPVSTSLFLFLLVPDITTSHYPFAFPHRSFARWVMDTLSHGLAACLP